MTDKYTRTFADFNNHPWPGKMLPEYFEHSPTIGDGYKGTQGMAQGALSAYGAYHVIEGCEFQSTGDVATEWSGSVGYAMFSGLIKVVPAASGALTDAGSYLVYNNNTTFDVTGAKPTGVILAHNIGGVIYSVSRRRDLNSKEYFPNDVYIYGDIRANTGQFLHLTGFSDITVDSSLDLKGNYHIKGVDQLTGANVKITNVKITNATQNIDFGGSYTLTSLASGDANGEPIRYNEYIAHQTNVSNPHTVTLQHAFDGGKIISGANSSINAFVVGAGSDWINLYHATNNIISSNDLLEIISDTNITLKGGTNYGVDIWTNTVSRWKFANDGTFEPTSANTYDIGSSFTEVKTLYYCNMSDTTCAYLGDYSYEDLYNLYAQIKPMKDGGLHYSESSKQYFPHINFKTLPKEFSIPAPEDIIKDNIWELNDIEEVVKRKVEYKIGDTIAIDAGVYLYGLGDLVVKMGEKIEALEKEIRLLKNN